MQRDDESGLQKGKQMKLAMLVTVGVGSTVSDGIAFAIRHRRPDFVMFLTTLQSEELTIPNLLETLTLDPEAYQCRRVDDENDVEKCTLDFISVIQNLKNRGFGSEDIVADYTSGTKAMSAGLVAAGLEAALGELSYIAGERDEGRVVSGTERAISLAPNRLRVRRIVEQAITEFNSVRFDTCLDMLNQIKELIRLQSVRQAVDTLQALALGYRAWDQFDYTLAMSELDGLTGYAHLSEWGLKSRLGRHKGFLYRVKNSDYGVERATDLWNSAERRKAEGRFDDAVARLYRLIEYIAQARLFRDHNGLKTSDLDISLLPESLRTSYKEKVGRSGKIELGLYESYALLKALDNDLGQFFIAKYDETEELKKVLGLRNQSILAHGFGPLSQNGCEMAQTSVRLLMDQAFQNWEDTARESAFPQLNAYQVIPSLNLSNEPG